MPFSTNDGASEFLPVQQLRIGHFVYIDLGWLSHPFPLNAFKIRSQDQIDTILGLGLERIRYSPEKSDPEALAPIPANAVRGTPVEGSVDAARRARLESLSRQRARLKACERQFGEASKAYRQVSEDLKSRPEAARQQTESLVRDIVDKLLANEESSIRLLSEQAGERQSLHSINVTVLSLLLGRAMGLDAGSMFDLGVGAVLHDVGKIALPDRLRWRDDQFTAAETSLYQEHVAYGVTEGRRLNLAPGAITVIAQHHEAADGSGYPRKLLNNSLTPASRIVALVNQYDNLCNAMPAAQGLTPHEALSHMFVQLKSRFDGVVLGAFIRMMGVYPPGSVVQLSDERFALVTSVNSSQPLKPQVVIYQPEIPSDEAIVANLEATPELVIRRSLKPAQLPRAVLDYLSPTERLCYFFERANVPDEDLALA